MSTFNYNDDIPQLSKTDISRHFNRHRVTKYFIDMLVKLGKTDLKNYKVLEPGCGGGDKLRFFAEMNVPPENCYGIEMSQSGVDRCKRLSPAAMNFQVGDAMNMPFEENFFDIVVCSGLFGCFQDDNDVKKLSAQIDKVLKQDGVLLLPDLNHNYVDFYGQNEAVMAKNLRGFNTETKELENLLAERFRIVKQQPIFVVDVLVGADGNPIEIENYPLVDYQIDQGVMKCSYSFWTFVKV